MTEQKVDKEFVKRWIKALRSGDYEQTQCDLRNDGGFCCLGVMCDLNNPDEWSGTTFMFEGKTYDALPPSSLVMNLLGKYHGNADIPLSAETLDHFEIEGDRENLAMLNDKGYTFEQIADIIEYEFLREEA